ncbi:MAG TPA: hypothetical protein VF599_12615 [Pyrinomonadaceae bacterium]|jgi:hypothetical protein
MICVYCEESIKPGDLIANSNKPLHYECALRSVVGSLAHQQRRCSCFSGTGEDEPNLSVRQNAKLATWYFKLQNHRERLAQAKFN